MAHSERVGVQVELWDPSRTRAIPERFCGGDSLRRGSISSACTFTFTLYLVIVANPTFPPLRKIHQTSSTTYFILQTDRETVETQTLPMSAEMINFNCKMVCLLCYWYFYALAAVSKIQQATTDKHSIQTRENGSNIFMYNLHKFCM